jgi:WXXGXW repeat (2 copies)
MKRWMLFGLMAATLTAAGDIWINGYWGYGTNSYVWIPGRWDRPPRGRRRWEDGRWERRGDRYRWYDGRWR